MNYSEAIAKLTEKFGTHWTGKNTQAGFDIPRGPEHTAVDVFDDGVSPIVFDHTLPPHYGAGTHPIHRVALPVVIVKIGQRSDVCSNELRHLPASAASEGGAA